MKAVITGNEGFIGRHFERVLKAQGWDVVGMDIKSGKDCRDFFKDSFEQFDLVIHAAAIVGGRNTMDNNPMAMLTDYSLDAEMFQWAVKTKQPHVLYFSSSAAYPKDYQVPHFHMGEEDIDLENIKAPENIYGWIKLNGEIMAQEARKQGVHVHVVRPFSGYGEDQDLDYPFPSFIKRIKERQDPFEIWGDGEQVRDFIHVEDIVGACLRMVELDIQEPINLGTAIPTSFNQLAQMMFDLSDFHPTVKHIQNNHTGVSYRVSRNLSMLKFYTPKISLLEGIARSL